MSVLSQPRAREFDRSLHGDALSLVYRQGMVARLEFDEGPHSFVLWNDLARQSEGLRVARTVRREPRRHRSQLGLSPASKCSAITLEAVAAQRAPHAPIESLARAEDRDLQDAPDKPSILFAGDIQVLHLRTERKATPKWHLGEIGWRGECQCRQAIECFATASARIPECRGTFIHATGTLRCMRPS
jgi:hypothetical protein